MWIMLLQVVKISCLPFMMNNLPERHGPCMNQIATAPYSERLVNKNFLIINTTNYNDQYTNFVKHDTFCSGSFGIMNVLIIIKLECSCLRKSLP